MEDHSNPLVIKLFDALKKLKISVPKFALEADIPKDRIYKWKQEDTSPKADDVEKINSWLAAKKLEKPPKMYSATELRESVVQEDQVPYGSPDRAYLTNKAVTSIAESNKILAEANRTLADAHKILARNNEELITMIKPATVNDGQGMTEAFSARFSDLLELLAQVGSGKKWKSVEEARAALNKYVVVPGTNG